MSADQLDLDAIEHTFRRAEEYALGVNPQQALALVAEVRRLRAAVQFKQGTIDDLAATVERLEAEAE